MKRKVLSALVAGIMGAVFGVLYPEYILLPDTYQYIEEMDCQGHRITYSEEKDGDILHWLLHSDSDRIMISSRLLQFLTDEGVLWMNVNSGMVNMP